MDANFRGRLFVGRLLLFTFVFNLLIGFAGALSPVQAQRRPIVINAEQPNVWTLEQAHYLLAQMHRRNLDLKATGAGELNPNQINGLNFEVLKSMLEVGVAFNDADRFNNSLLKTKRRFDADRAIKLQSRRDELADESLALNRDIARLTREQTLADSQEDKDRLAAQVAELQTVKQGVDAEIARLDADIKTAGGPTGELQPTAPPESPASKLPESVFDTAFKDVTKKLIDEFNQQPKLNATIRLDNFLQMQYEIIAKQLTLLRDEVGPGERIIFLEMPQSLNATYDKADKKWAQSWWKILGYTVPNAERLDIMQAIRQPNNTRTRDTRQMVSDALQAVRGELRYNTAIRGNSVELCVRRSSNVSFVELNCQQEPADGRILPQNSSVRTIELIPRQSSLNVNDIKLRVRSGVLTAVVQTLFGFGARLNFQRQRENFSQFVQQELYSSGFGKGSTEFGWTFQPMPGTDRVMSGARTTYAVMVVPIEAEALVMETTGCYFPRSDYQPISFRNTTQERWTSSESRRCSEHKAFVVPIPGGGADRNNDFWVNGLEYTAADNGDRVVLTLFGRNFPAQIGMMVDGVPLTQSIGVAQPLIRDDSAAFQQASAELSNAKVIGRIERIDSEQVVAVFEKPNGKNGVQPVITLTAPGKARILNGLTLNINGVNQTLEQAPLMFANRPTKAPFRIDRVEIFRSATTGNLMATVTGAGFRDSAGAPAIASVMINGNSSVAFSVDSPSHMRVEFRIPADEHIRVTLVSQNANPAAVETVISDPVRNPFMPQ